jgi:very-short-patch-repair endonuclease
MNKYGDTCPSKASNPRTAEQLEILSNKEMFAYFIIKYASMCGKPNSYELAKIFSVDRATILNKVRQYNIENMIVIKSNISNEEKQLQEYIKSITTCNVITNSKKIVDNYELDIYIPEKKIAIEFNGTYWHSTLQKDKKYHQNKTLACAKQGIRLIHIFEYEWKDEVTQTKIKEYLSSLLNDNRNVIYARKTEIKEITSETAKQFLEQYHLQGYIASKINIGCFYENNLIGVLTFGFPRFNHSCQYELHRLCWKSNVAVIGGLEKMFSYFKKTYNPTSIITYSDITKFTGNCYLKLGFKVESITEPNYVWVEDSTNKVLPRYQTQKHKLIKAGLGEETQTEDEIMNSLGYLKVYNSGNIKLYWE